MKFRDGYWHVKKGYSQISYVELWEADIRRSAPRIGEPPINELPVHEPPVHEPQVQEPEVQGLYLYAATKKFNHRGDTLNSPMLTTILSSPMPNIIHVRSFRHSGTKLVPPVFDLVPDRSVREECIAFESLSGDDGGVPGGKEGKWIYSAGPLRAEVSADGPFNINFFYEENALTSALGKLSGHFTDHGGNTFMVQNLSLGVGETIYGLGERFTSFAKNGQVVDIWNEDGGTSSELSYKNIPFYISGRGYGVLVNSAGRVSFEVASEAVSAVQFSVPGELLDYYIISGDDLKSVMRNYGALCGRPVLPPAWSFGLWLSTSFTTDYDEKTVNRFIDGMAERKIPLSVFHFDCFWMKAFQWVDFKWDKAQFPEPQAMLARLKKKGLKICVWINPYIAQKSYLFDEGMERGFLVKKANGDVWQWDLWQAGMGLVDFTNPDAASWYQEKLGALLDMGVDTFKTDFGERIPVDVVWHNGADSAKMHNYYTYLYNKTVFDLLEKKRGKGDALVFARSATVGGQCFPVHWGGDCSATYESMAETLRGGLSLGLSGFGFWSHDISGFESTATADLFKRWTAFGLLSSHSRLHGNESYRVPWNFDDEASGVLKFFTELKFALMPYLYRSALEAVLESQPMLRAMVLEFPEDPSSAFLDRQYMLGSSLLAAPVFNESGAVTYYLPKGKWTNIISGEAAEGPSWHTETHGYFSLPLLARPNSIIAMGNEKTSPDYDYSNGVCFHVFELEEDSAAAAELCDSKGNIEGKIEVSRRKGTVTAVSLGLLKPWSLCLRNLHKYVSSTGSLEVKDSKEGLIFSMGGGRGILTVELR